MTKEEAIEALAGPLVLNLATASPYLSRFTDRVLLFLLECERDRKKEIRIAALALLEELSDKLSKVIRIEALALLEELGDELREVGTSNDVQDFVNRKRKEIEGT